MAICSMGFTYADEAVRENEKGHMSIRFNHVVMRNGIIEFPAPEDIPDKDRRILHKMQVKKFGEARRTSLALKNLPMRRWEYELGRLPVCFV